MFAQRFLPLYVFFPCINANYYYYWFFFRDVPYKTLLLSISDSAAFIVEEMLEKYGRDRREASQFCLVQVRYEI